jgi:hypothetical protein
MRPRCCCSSRTRCEPSVNSHSLECLPHQVDHILDCLPHQVDHILNVDTPSDAHAYHPYLCAECSRRFRTLRGFQRHSDFRRSRGRCPVVADGPVSPAKASPPPGGSPPHRAWDKADLGPNLGANLGPNLGPNLGGALGGSRSPPSYSTHTPFDAALASRAAQLGTSFGRASPNSFVNSYDGLSGTMGYASGHSATRGSSFARVSSPYASSSAASIGRQPGSHVACAQHGAHPHLGSAYATPCSSLETPYRALNGSPRADSASSASGYSPGRGHPTY